MAAEQQHNNRLLLLKSQIAEAGLVGWVAGWFGSGVGVLVRLGRLLLKVAWAPSGPRLFLGELYPAIRTRYAGGSRTEAYSTATSKYDFDSV